jgi:pSer/pThr/pTyr-binding forkhead associated (FHA) protein
VDSNAQPEQSTQTSTPVVQQNYKIGDVIAIGDYVLVVLGWENVQPNDFSQPNEGKKFMAVDLLLVNKSQSAVLTSAVSQVSIKDNTNQKYDVDIMASMATGVGSVDGELAAGEKLRGKVGFQIPTNAQGLQLVFDASSFNTGKVFVDLGAEPYKIEPPIEIAGETAQQTFPIGDTIAIGTTNITVNEVLYPTGDQFNQPKAGFKFLVVDLTIENLSTTSITVSTLLQMSVKDSSSQKYDADFMAALTSGGGSLDAEIAPGEKLRGQVGFQVPINAIGLVFVFDADFLSSGKVFIVLQ